MDILTGEFDIDKISLTIAPYPTGSIPTKLIEGVKDDFLIISPAIHPSQQRSFFSQLIVDVVTKTTVTFTRKASVRSTKEYSLVDFVRYTELNNPDKSGYNINVGKTLENFLSGEALHCGMIDAFSAHDVRSIADFVDTFSVPTDDEVDLHISHMKLVLPGESTPGNIRLLFYVGVLVLKTVLMRVASRTTTDPLDMQKVHRHPILPEHVKAIFSTPMSSVLCLKAMAIDSEFVHKLSSRAREFRLRIDIHPDMERFVPTNPSLRDIPAIIAEIMDWEADLVVDYAIIYILVHNMLVANKIDTTTNCIFRERKLKKVRPFILIDAKHHQIIYELK